jgi:hypothetical protein
MTGLVAVDPDSMKSARLPGADLRQTSFVNPMSGGWPLAFLGGQLFTGGARLEAHPAGQAAVPINQTPDGQRIGAVPVLHELSDRIIVGTSSGMLFEIKQRAANANP